MNLLSQRIKEAKRELTALKTSHRRGLGLLKIYTQTIDAPPPSGSSIFWWLTVNVTFDLAEYPFVQMYYVWDGFASLLDYGALEFQYSNDGYSIEYRDRVVKLGVPYKIIVYSTSPIKSISYSWSTN